MLDILQVNMLCRLFSFLMHAMMSFTQGYFDSRMEVKCDNIDVQLVCPGPVLSNISSNAFSSQLDKVFIFTILLYLIDVSNMFSRLQIWKKLKRVE